MANKRPKPEEIVMKLRQVEISTEQGMLRLDAIRQIGVTEQSYYRWKKSTVEWLCYKNCKEPYDAPEYHHHKTGAPPAQCRSCNMVK